MAITSNSGLPTLWPNNTSNNIGSNWISWNIPQSTSMSYANTPSVSNLNNGVVSLPSGLNLNMNTGNFQLGNGMTDFEALQKAWNSLPDLGNQSNGLWGSVDGWVTDNFGNWGNAFGSGLQLFQGINNMINARKAFNLANDQFNFQKGIAQANLANAIKSYNTALEDRIKSRYVMEGKSSEEADKYINEHKL